MADFKLDRTTDPKSITLEGRPDVEIVAIGEGEDYTKDYPRPKGLYVYAKHFDGDGDEWDGGTYAAQNNGYDVEPGMLVYASVFCTFDGQSKWGRIVPRFVLTKDTDPAKVMFENRPDIVIAGFRERPEVVCSRPGQLYVRFRTSDSVYEQTLAHNSDGTWASGGSNYGPVVPRPTPAPALDPLKPFHAVSDHGGSIYRYELDATITPADGSEPRYVVKRSKGENNAGATLEVFASTGRVTGGLTGAGLRFVNGPVIETHDAIVMASKYAATVRLTATDGVVTAVEWLK